MGWAGVYIFENIFILILSIEIIPLPWVSACISWQEQPQWR
jgi:hypothetical protein